MSTPITNEIRNNQCNKKNNFDIISPHHTLQIKRQENIFDFSKKSIYDFRIVVIGTPPKLIDKDKETIETYFGSSSKEKS